jgi:hypothetical protein
MQNRRPHFKREDNMKLIIGITDTIVTPSESIDFDYNDYLHYGKIDNYKYELSEYDIVYTGWPIEQLGTYQLSLYQLMNRRPRQVIFNQTYIDQDKLSVMFSIDTANHFLKEMNIVPGRVVLVNSPKIGERTRMPCIYKHCSRPESNVRLYWDVNNGLLAGHTLSSQLSLLDSLKSVPEAIQIHSIKTLEMIEVIEILSFCNMYDVPVITTTQKDYDLITHKFRFEPIKPKNKIGL